MDAQMSPDYIANRVFAILNASSAKPADLKILDHDLLPAEVDEMPVCGVYLVDDKLVNKIDSMTNERLRAATVRVEIRKVGSMLSTKSEREWVIETILTSPALLNEVLEVEFQGFQPYGIASEQRLAGADLDFSITYVFNTPGGLYG